MTRSLGFYDADFELFTYAYIKLKGRRECEEKVAPRGRAERNTRTRDLAAAAAARAER